MHAEYRLSILPLVLLTAAAWASEAPQAAIADVTAATSFGVAHPFSLTDQFKESHTIAFPSDKVLFLIFADRDGAEQIEGWIEPTYLRYRESIDIEGVAVTRGVPGFMRGFLRSVFRNTLDYAVMQDWEGAITERYAYEPGMANAMVIDASGTIVHRVHGAATPERLAVTHARIDALMAQVPVSASAP